MAVGFGGQLTKRQVVALHLAEDGVGPLLMTGQQAVEAHPFGASQGRGFHVVGAFNQRDVGALEGAVAALVEGRHQHGFGLAGNDELGIGLKGTP